LQKAAASRRTPDAASSRTPDGSTLRCYCLEKSQ